MKSHMNLLTAAVRYLEKADKKRKDRRELIHHAICGMGEFYRERDFYTAQIKECSIFMKELQDSIECLEKAMASKEEEEVVFDCCFTLFEALCSIFREASLARGHMTEVEKQLLAYFEKSGHWLSSDTTIVAEMYFQTLPDKYATH